MENLTTPQPVKKWFPTVLQFSSQFEWFWKRAIFMQFEAYEEGSEGRKQAIEMEEVAYAFFGGEKINSVSEEERIEVRRISDEYCKNSLERNIRISKL